MSKFVIGVHLLEFKAQSATVLSDSKDERPTALDVRKHQIVKVQNQGHFECWCSDEHGNDGWVPRSILEFYEEPMAVQTLEELELQAKIQSDQTSQICSFEFKYQPIPHFSIAELALAVDSGEVLVVDILFGLETVIGRCEFKVDVQSTKNIVCHLSHFVSPWCTVQLQLDHNSEENSSVEVEPVKSMPEWETGENVLGNWECSGSYGLLSVSGILYLTNLRLRFLTEVASLDELFQVYLFSIDYMNSVSAVPSFIKEYARMGSLAHGFRVSSANTNYSLCATYPQVLFQPGNISDKELNRISSFRRLGRIPILVWSRAYTCLFKSSQPLTGIFGGRCEEDQKYFQCASIKYVVEARSKSRVRRDKWRGYGVEEPEVYSMCQTFMLGIESTQKLKQSFEALFGVFAKQDFLLELHQTRWFQHLSSALEGAQCIASLLCCLGASVLVHCTKGLDRTCVLTSLAQLLIDSYYRTFEGFKVLVAKEWNSHGYPFFQRAKGSKQTPTFFLFLDGVHQVRNQFEEEFEFTEKYVEFLADASLTGLYAEFLADSELDLMEKKGSYRSVWDEFRTEFVSGKYLPTLNKMLRIETQVKELKLWSFFSRLNDHLP